MSLVIIGAGGFGREVADVIEAADAEAPSYALQGFVDDSPAQANLDQVARRGYEYLGSLETHLRAPRATNYIIGIADGTARRRIDAKLRTAGHRAVTVVHPAASIGSCVELGPGSVLCAGVRVTTNVVLGRHVHLNPNATVGHDSRLEDYVTVYPAAAISGNCLLEEGSSMGAGSIVLQGRTIGRGAFVGAAALVTRDTAPAVTVKGVPAR